MTSEITSKELLDEWDWETGRPTGRRVSRPDFYPLLFSEKMKIYMNVIISGARELVSHGTVSVRMPEK